MITIQPFDYQPDDHESERACNSYLMSLVAIVAGLPLPILNLLATLIFYLGNRKGAYFVRWHCTQALLSQVSVLLVNSVGFWWTVSIVFRDGAVTNSYIAYMITAIIFNLIEFGTTIYTAIQVRKGIHVKWWLIGDLADQICEPKGTDNTFAESKYGW
jgi:uncharacterized membrane protein